MILDTLKHHALYTNIHPMFKKAFDYLLKTDFHTLTLGKHLIDGDKLFVLFQAYETKDATDCKLENHKKYIDIQYIVNGEELVGVTSLNGQTASIPYDETTDVAFYVIKHESIIKLEKGHFAIFFPHDLHRPCIKTDAVSNVRKAVFKIHIEETKS